MSSPPLLAKLFARVQATRQANEDVFVWPGIVWDMMYTIEEITELARGVQRLYAPEHARNSQLKGVSLNAYLQGEWGQALMMLLTLGLELQREMPFDPDMALDMAIEKIYAVAERQRKDG